MASTAEEAQLARQQVIVQARQTLRTTCPYLKDEALQKLLSGIASLVDSTLKEQEQIIDNSKAGTGFLSLAPELRNNIYNFALDDIAATKAKEDPRSDKSRRKYNSMPALCQVSKQVRGEAMPMFLDQHVFKFAGKRQGNIWRVALITDWLQSLDLQYTMHIKKVVLGLSENRRNPATGEVIKSTKQEVLNQLQWWKFGMKNSRLSFSSHLGS